MDELTVVRDAVARQDWEGAAKAARGMSCGDALLEAQRYDLLADATWWLGSLEDCTVARETAHRLYTELGDQQGAGQAAVWLYEHHAFAARPAISGAWLRRARTALEEHPDCLAHGALLLREAETAHSGGRLSEGIALADRALAIGTSLRSADLQAEALQTKGRLLLDSGELEGGMRHLDDAMLFAVEGRLGPYSTGKVYCSLISACEELGDFDRAAEWTEATMKWAQQHPFAIFPGICRIHRAIVLKRRGALAEAEHEAELACEELRGRHVANTAAAYAEMGDIRRRLGDLVRAAEAFEMAEQLSGHPCGGLALLRLAQGRTDLARSIIESCLTSAGSHAGARSGLLPVQVHIAIAAGDLEGAAVAMDDLERLASGNLVLRATTTSTRGRLQLARGEWSLAATTLRSAVEQWQVLDVPYEVATARTLLGQSLREAGDADLAVESFAAAVALFDQIGARLESSLVPAPGARELPAGLTERELTVLQLICEGMSNNEIAEQLFLSSKTVSRHLSNIFTKIDVGSRSAATAYAFEHDLVQRRRTS